MEKGATRVKFLIRVVNGRFSRAPQHQQVHVQVPPGCSVCWPAPGHRFQLVLSVPPHRSVDHLHPMFRGSEGSSDVVLCTNMAE